MFLKQLQNKNCCVCLYRGTGAGRLWPNPNNGNTVRYFRKLSWCLIRGWISHIWQTWLINKLLASQIPYSSSSPGTYVVTDRFFFLHLWCCLSWKNWLQSQSLLSCFHRVLQEEQEVVDVLQEHLSCQVQQVMAYHIPVYWQHYWPFYHRNGAWPRDVRTEFHNDSLKCVNLPLCVHRLH